MNKYVVTLTDDEIRELDELTRKGRVSARQVKRANTLLLAHDGKSDSDICDVLRTGESTVHRTRQRFVEGNLEFALNEQARAGRPRKLSGRQEAILVATACSDPPRGQVRWTLKLLAERMVALNEGAEVSMETVRTILKKTKPNRG